MMIKAIITSHIKQKKQCKNIQIKCIQNTITMRHTNAQPTLGKYRSNTCVL